MVASLLLALAIVGSGAEEDAARVTITGRVVAPKRSGLSVWLNGRQFHTLTTKSGNFTFGNVAAGECLSRMGRGGGGALHNQLGPFRAKPHHPPTLLQACTLLK